jgi:hypothetical protein
MTQSQNQFTSNTLIGALPLQVSSPYRFDIENLETGATLEGADVAAESGAMVRRIERSNASILVGKGMPDPRQH